MEGEGLDVLLGEVGHVLGVQAGLAAGPGVLVFVFGDVFEEAAVRDAPVVVGVDVVEEVAGDVAGVAEGFVGAALAVGFAFDLDEEFWHV